MSKTPISMRLDAALVKAAKKVAKLENRTFTNLITTMIIERCQEHGIKI